MPEHLTGVTLETLSTDELIHLNNILSGGTWLGLVRRALNFRVVCEAEYIRQRVGAHSWNVIGGRR